jgi:hypothetical protein
MSSDNRAMKATSLLCLGLLLAGCGNYSNDDLEFLLVLPARESLESKLPNTDTHKQGLMANGMFPTASGIGVGEPSKSFTDARNASIAFNLWVYSVLVVVDFVRGLPFTSKTETSRTWGPWPSLDYPGYLVRVTMARTGDEAFTFRAEVKKTDAGDDTYVTTLDGELFSDGHGELRYLPHDAKLKGVPVPAEHKDFTQVKISYALGSWPISVGVDLTSAVGQAPVVYSFKLHENGSGVMKFAFSLNVVGSLLTDAERFDTETRWLADGTGKAIAHVTSVDVPVNTQQTECWDSRFTTTYLLQSWFGGSILGSEGACPNVSGL